MSSRELSNSVNSISFSRSNINRSFVFNSDSSKISGSCFGSCFCRFDVISEKSTSQPPGDLGSGISFVVRFLCILDKTNYLNKIDVIYFS